MTSKVDRPTIEQVDAWLALAASAAKVPAGKITSEGFLGLAAEVRALRDYERKFVRMLVYAEHLEFKLEQLEASQKSSTASGEEQNADGNLLAGLLTNARAVLRERVGGALTIDERKLLDTVVKITGQAWPACLVEVDGCERFAGRGH